MMYTYPIPNKIEETIPNEILGQSGCYVLYSTEWNNGISRLNGIDQKGILYIGKADILHSRLISLQKSILANCDIATLDPIEKGHKALSRKFFRIRAFTNVNFLKVDVFPAPLVPANILESYMLESYVKQYGELPPLNGQYGNYDLHTSKEMLLNGGYIIPDFLELS